MKRILFTMLAAVLMLPVFAKTADINPNGVMMVGFRQEYGDRHAYITLRNNMEGLLTRVKGTVSFYDEQGNLLEQRAINERVRLQKGEMAEVPIKAYGRKDGYISGSSLNDVPEGAEVHRFAARFALKDYTLKGGDDTPLTKREQKAVAQAEEEAKAAETKAADERLWNIIRISAGVLILILIVLFYFYIPIRMAERRGRFWLPWVAIALLATPIIPIFALWLLGNKKDDSDFPVE